MTNNSQEKIFALTSKIYLLKEALENISLLNYNREDEEDCCEHLECIIEDAIRISREALDRSI